MAEASSRNVVLTGAAGGMGGAITKALLESGRRVVLADRDPASLRAFAAEMGDNTFPSEAVVTPEGWVLSLVYDGSADASYVAVVDGARPEDGPVARLWFDHAIPFLFHGAWAR